MSQYTEIRLFIDKGSGESVTFHYFLCCMPNMYDRINQHLPFAGQSPDIEFMALLLFSQQLRIGSIQVRKSNVLGVKIMYSTLFARF